MDVDERIQVDILRGEVRRLLRYRIPLTLIVLANFALLARLPITQMWAEAAPPRRAETTGPAVAEPTQRFQTPLTRPLVHVSQNNEILPTESAVPLPSTAPAGVSPFAFTSSCGLAVQRLITRWSVPFRQTDPAAKSRQAAEPVPIPDTKAVAEPPAMNRAGASPFSHLVDSPSTGLTIRNAVENEAPVRFLVNSRVCELQPGEAHDFAANTSWTVQFHRGESFGNAQQTLVPGVYRFVVTGQGWDLEANR